MSLTCGFVRDALAGKAKIVATQFDAQRVLNRVWTDSRTIAAGDLFVAYKGEVMDGHDFIAQAVERGCRAVLCEKYPSAAPQEGVDIFLVENTLESFRILAKTWRGFLGTNLIAVAGSVGKTTTKDILAAMLSGKWPKVLKTTGSQNGFFGIPMTLMELRDEHDAAVIEVGIDAPDAMLQHIDVVRPDVALVTAISEEHLEWLKDLKTIAYEENLILQETAQAGGVAIINLDDPWIKPMMESIKSSTKIGFTMQGSAGPQTLRGQLVDAGEVLEVSGMNISKFSVPMPLPGEHNARNLLGAVAAALVVGVKPDEIKKGMESFAPSGGRSQMEKTPSGLQVLCDFYNANPASMKAAFEVAKSSHKTGSLWLCLADMKELGEQEEALHRDLAASILKLPKDTKILLYGERMNWLSDELRKQKFSGMLENFSSHETLGSHLKKHLQKNDFVLLKGSRSMKMERVWESLRTF